MFCNLGIVEFSRGASQLSTHFGISSETNNYAFAGGLLVAKIYLSAPHEGELNFCEST